MITVTVEVPDDVVLAAKGVGAEFIPDRITEIAFHAAAVKGISESLPSSPAAKEWMIRVAKDPKLLEVLGETIALAGKYVKKEKS